MATAVVVGSGPNGLAAAIELARNGIDVRVVEAADRIGGGTRSSEYIVDGLLHDDCSAFHPHRSRLSLSQGTRCRIRLGFTRVALGMARDRPRAPPPRRRLRRDSLAGPRPNV